jgi:hypothetical protein
VSRWLIIVSEITSETQRTQRLHREEFRMSLERLISLA